MTRLSLAPDSPEIQLVIPDAELRAALADLLRVDGFATQPFADLGRARGDRPRRAPIARIVDATVGQPDVHAFLVRLAREHDGTPTILVVSRKELVELARRLGLGCVEIPFGRYALSRELARVRCART